ENGVVPFPTLRVVGGEQHREVPKAPARTGKAFVARRQARPPVMAPTAMARAPMGRYHPAVRFSVRFHDWPIHESGQESPPAANAAVASPPGPGEVARRDPRPRRT